MRLGRATIEKYTARDRATRKEVTLYRARWRAYPTDGGRVLGPKRAGFRQKGHAEAFIGTLRLADRRVDGWTVDARGYPVPPPPVVSAPSESVLDAAQLYVGLQWDTDWKSPKTREKNRGRLLVLVAALIDDEAAAARVIAALDTQSGSRGNRRPDPVTIEERAARWLRDHALVPDADDGGIDPALAEARDWLAARSLPLTALDDRRLRFVRRFLTDGRPRTTARTYWQTVSTFLTWTVKSHRLDRDPAAGMPALKRDLDAEQVDAERVPTEAEVHRLADAARDRFGSTTAMVVLLAFYLAARIGEIAGLRRGDIKFLPTGGAMVTIRRQEGRVTARYSDDGKTRSEKPPKGRTSGPGARRRVYIPARAAAALRSHLDSSVDPEPGARVLAAPRGGPFDDDSFRRDRWDLLVAQLFPDGHRLAGITPHALRHAGMTMWLRHQVPLKLCQRMGGWHSLKVMLDVYAAVLPDDIDVAIAALEDEGPTAEAA